MIYQFSPQQARQIAIKLNTEKPVVAAHVIEIVAEIAPDYMTPIEPDKGWEFVDEGDYRWMDIPASNLTVLDSGMWSVAIGGNVW